MHVPPRELRWNMDAEGRTRKLVVGRVRAMLMARDRVDTCCSDGTSFICSFVVFVCSFRDGDARSDQVQACLLLSDRIYTRRTPAALRTIS